MKYKSAPWAVSAIFAVAFLLVMGIYFAIDKKYRKCISNFDCWYEKHRNPKIKRYEIVFIKKYHREEFEKEAKKRKVNPNSGSGNTLAAGMAINMVMGRSIVSPVGIGIAFAGGF